MKSLLSPVSLSVALNLWSVVPIVTFSNIVTCYTSHIRSLMTSLRCTGIIIIAVIVSFYVKCSCNRLMDRTAKTDFSWSALITTFQIVVCPMQFMALDRYKITWVFVCVCVSAKRFVHDSDHNFCPIFLKFGTWVRNVIVKTPFGGQVPKVNSPPFIPQKPLFGENLLLKPMDSVTAYILTTTKAIITKLDQHIKQIEL